MKSITITLIFLAGLFPQAFSQVPAPADTAKIWDLGGMGAVTYNEVGLFNWAAGGQSNMTMIGNVNVFANRNWEKGSWENSLDLAYGFLRSNFIFDPQAPSTKAEDRVEINSKYGRKTGSEELSYTGLLTFRTQFAPGFARPGDEVYISRAMAPGYLIIAAGMDYKPNDALSIFLSPISGKATFVLDDSLAAEGAFGVNQTDAQGEPRLGAFRNYRIEFGATFKAKYKQDIMENVGLESMMELFSNYMDRPQNVDVRWANSIVAKINKFLAVNLITDLIYDHDFDIPIVDSKGEPVYSMNPEPMPAPYNDGTYWPGPDFHFTDNPDDVVQVQRKGPRVQFKQVFGVGLTYKF